MWLVLDDRSPRFYGFEGLPQWARFDSFPVPGATGPVTFFSVQQGEMRVLEAARDESSFSVRYRSTGGQGPGASNVEEYIAGSLRDGRLALAYTISGTLYGAAIAGWASGLLTRRGSHPPPASALAGRLWSGEVNVVRRDVPDGRPDRMLLGFHDDGRLSFVGLTNVHHRQAFGNPPRGFPLSGRATVSPPETTLVYQAEVLSAVWSPRAFELKVLVRGAHDSYTETIAGALGEQGLDVQLTIDGMAYPAGDDVRASGRLLP